MTVEPRGQGTVSAIVVAFSDPEAVRRAVDSLLRQTHAPIEVLVVDNDPGSATARAMAGWDQDLRVRLVHGGRNLGYTVACNLAASSASGDWLFFLNPDATAEPDCVGTLIRAATDRTGAVGAQVLLPDGRTNAGDNPVHVTGVAWAGRFGEPSETGPVRRVASVSGAALLARADVYRDLGGMCARFFMYGDDVDLCWRMRLAGSDVLFCPDAVVWHEYTFDRGRRKWYWLERNRLWTVLSNYSGAVLWLLAPLLIGAELRVLVLAIRGRWVRALVRAWGSTLLGIPELRRWRRFVQAGRRVRDSELLELMSGHFETAQLHDPVVATINPAIEFLRRGLIGLLRAVNR